MGLTHPITRTLGGYRYSALPTKDTTTHTLLTNPTTHYKASDDGILPNNPNTWIPYSSTIPKTIYDPCPYGYRVPINGSWADFPINKWTQFAIIGGTSWPTENGDWWPTAGFRERSNAILCNIGNGSGCYWSSSRHDTANAAYNLGLNYTGGVGPSYGALRSWGFSVRCIEEYENKRSSF